MKIGGRVGGVRVVACCRLRRGMGGIGRAWGMAEGELWIRGRLHWV